VQLIKNRDFIVFKGVVRGFNGTIFAYGQTSSGKTFTMEGPSIDSDENKGIIPRMMDEMFDCIMRANESIEFTVKVSFLEIYNEKIHDLLDRFYSFLLVFINKIIYFS
jgi:kinesin family protein 5